MSGDRDDDDEEDDDEEDDDWTTTEVLFLRALTLDSERALVVAST